jgi:AcrR family transcriptional regulator
MIEPAGKSDRRRGAGDSRARLLAAAGELFAEKGYEKTTVRKIGERADVDAALIARYFGSKADLYVESLRTDTKPSSVEPLDLVDAREIEELLDRASASGPKPTLHAAIRPHEDPELQSVAMELLRRRLLSPSELRARDSGLDSPELRAEMAVAALAGIVLSRSSKAFPTLSEAPAAEVSRLIADLIGNLVAP